MTTTPRVKILAASLTFCALTFSALTSHAGGCVLKTVTAPKMLASNYLASLVKEKVKALDAEAKRNGQEMKVVIVARSGESLGGFDVVKDDIKQPLPKYLNRLAKQAEDDAAYSDNGSSFGTARNLHVSKEMFSKEKMKYSHVTFYVKRYAPNSFEWLDPNADDWDYGAHLLAECDKKSNRYGESYIFRTVLNEFFWDTKILEKKSSAANNALIIVPAIEIQDRLLKLLENKSIAESMHTPKYNVAATPFKLAKSNLKNDNYFQLSDQNSNQWPIEMIAAASRPYGQVTNREQAQRVLWQTNFRPSLLNAHGLKESSACALKKGSIFGIINLWDATNLINCEDQIYRDYNLYQIITVNSLVNYLDQNKLLYKGDRKQSVFEVAADPKQLDKLDELGKLIDKITGVTDTSKNAPQNMPN